MIRPGQLFPGEADAIKTTLDLGGQYGYGNLIDHLRNAWSKMLREKYGIEDWDNWGEPAITNLKLIAKVKELEAEVDRLREYEVMYKGLCK